MKQSELETMVAGDRHRGSGSEKHFCGCTDRTAGLKLLSEPWGRRGSQLSGRVENAADTCGLGEHSLTLA